MKKINQYIIREYFAPVLMATGALTFLMLLNRFYKLMDLIFSKGLSILLVAKLLALSMPFIIAETFPMSVLVSTLMVYGRLSADNEVTAFKASGISTLQIIRPSIYLSIGFVGLMFWFHNFVLPNSNHALANLLINVQRIRPIQDLEPGIFNQLLNYDIYISSKNDKESKIYGIVIYENTKKENFNYPRIITAEHGEILLSEDESTMIFNLYNGEISEVSAGKSDEYKLVSFDEQTIYLKEIGQKMQETEREFRGDRELSMFALDDKISHWQDKNSELRIENADILPKMITSMNELIKDKMATGENRYRIERKLRQNKSNLERNNMLIQANMRNINRYRIEYHKKMSIPFACFVFILFGAPLGIMARKGGIGVAGSISLIFFIIYYVGLVSGEDLGDRGIISPFLGMWGINIIFFIFGTGLVALSMNPNLRWKIRKRLKAVLAAPKAGNNDTQQA